MSACSNKPGLSPRKRLGAHGAANLPRSPCRKPSSGFRDTKPFGKGHSTLSNAISAERKTRRTNNGNAAIATGKLAPAKTHFRCAAGQSIPRLDRRQGVRAVVSPDHRPFHHHFASRFEGGREIQFGNAPQGRRGAQA